MKMVRATLVVACLVGSAPSAFAGLVTFEGQGGLLVTIELPIG